MLFAISLSYLLVAGCGYDSNKCYESVVKAYPNAEISLIPGEKYRFLVRENGGDVIYVETMNNADADITQKFTAFRGN